MLPFGSTDNGSLFLGAKCSFKDSLKISYAEFGRNVFAHFIKPLGKVMYMMLFLRVLPFQRPLKISCADIGRTYRGSIFEFP